MVLIQLGRESPILYDSIPLQEDVNIATILGRDNFICSEDIELESFCILSTNTDDEFLPITYEMTIDRTISVNYLTAVKHEILLGSSWVATGKLRKVHDGYFEFLMSSHIKIFCKQFGWGSPL